MIRQETNNTLKSLLENSPNNGIIIDSFVKADSVFSKDYDTIYCSVSGGADSDILVDICSKFHKDIRYIYFDTGMEYKATKDHLKYLEDRYGIEIVRIRAYEPVPLAVKRHGQPFLSKVIASFIYRLQNHNFKFEDRQYEELIKEYPNCKSALMWWCNKNKTDRLNIRGKSYLKEFMIENPPTFQISSECCKYAKKKTAKVMRKGLTIIGIRQSEGGIRSILVKNCFQSGKDKDIYRPIFWYSDNDRKEYEEHYCIKHSKCYTEYGLPRTGCVGCPFGKDFEYELAVCDQYEPMLSKAARNVFAESYEYTRKYREYRDKKKHEEKMKKIGYQYSLTDYLN